MTFTSANRNTYNVALNQSESRLQVVANNFHISSEQAIIGDFVDADDVITTDGITRNIYVINGQFPGPTLEVLEGAKVRL